MSEEQKFQLEPFTKEDLDLLGALLDSGIKAEGLKVVKIAAYILQKIERAKPITTEKEKNDGTEELIS